MPRTKQYEYDQNGAITVFQYQDPTIKKLIWLLKYRGVKEIGQILGEILYENFIEQLAENEIYHPTSGQILVVPVPLSPKRQKKRGFNQAEEIAKIFSQNDSRSFSLVKDLLIKTKETKSQVTIRERTQRLNNLGGVFAIKDKKKIRGKTIILLDDVTTTGTTLTECEKVLKKKGAWRVIKMAVAHG